MTAKPLYLILLFLGAVIGFSCHGKGGAGDAKEDADVPADEIRTPVTVTTVSTEPLSDSLTLNATANFIQSNIVKSNINGYIQTVSIKVGQYAGAGHPLFTLITKEARSLGNTINKLDPGFHFSGTVNIASPQSGYITQLNHQIGDYVQDGEQLAIISDARSFGFILNVPYEFRKYITMNKQVQVLLPDGSMLPGNIAYMMPTIDSASQTQTVLVRVHSTSTIPQNLVAKVRILKTEAADAQSLPKQAVLTDESQSSFWIMKMIDSITAVKIPVTKGLETTDRVQILQPKLASSDRILLTGNYGLPDTAKVKIIKGEE